MKMKRGETLSIRGQWLCSIAVIVSAVLLSATPAGAHQSPANCTDNNLGLDLAKNKTNIVSGETVHYTVRVDNLNPDGQGCDITGANTSFTCPAPDGTPTGAVTVCAVNANYPAGFPTTVLCEVDCVVTVNPGVTSAQAKAEVHGILHDNPLNDNDTADVVKFISVNVLICGDGILNVPGETCDPPGSATDNPPNTCRANCTYCGDGIVDTGAGEECEPGQPNCSNTCTILPFCGDEIVGNTPGETCDPPGSATDNPPNLCRADCTYCGDGIVNGGEECEPGQPNCTNVCTLEQPCSVVITKTVAPDDGSGGGTACDGTADGLFVENVTVDETSCVVYEICVRNTGQQILNGNGVKVSDPVLGTVNFDFGTIAVGAEVCKQAPGVMTAPNCTGGLGASCVCTEVEGVNTATITAAICEATQVNACSEPGSDCSDTANVACLGPGSCRMTGGHNYDVVDATFNENGKVYTTGGQIGAPNESGCCDLPPKGKCVNGTCTGGLNGGLACSSNEQCPNDPGRNSHCPWGDWEHNHHSGPDDSNSVKGGSFAFHSGTAAAPDAAFIKSVQCADPGWCVQARPAPFKQIYWEGTGVFHNMKGPKGSAVPLPIFGACANQPVPYSNRTNGTLHYYKAHVSDFGEPAGRFQKPIEGCQKDESCTSREPNQSVEINDCTLGDVCLIDAVADPVKTALHPLCLAQTCSECPDEYEIEIHCTADPNSPVAYRVSHEIREGNFQLHPPVGDSCNFSCGDGVCETGFDGAQETCATCAEDCCP